MPQLKRREKKCFMLLLIEEGCYLGLLLGGEGVGVWEGGFCCGFFGVYL